MFFTIQMAMCCPCSGRFWQFEVRCPDNAFYDFNFAPRDGSPATSRLCQADKGWPGQISSQANPNSGLSKTWRISPLSSFVNVCQPFFCISTQALLYRHITTCTSLSSRISSQNPVPVRFPTNSTIKKTQGV